MRDGAIDRINSYSEHHEALVGWDGDWEDYARAHNLPVSSLREDLIQTGVMDQIMAANAQRAMVKMRRVLDKKSDIAEGYVEIIEELKEKILAILRGETYKSTSAEGGQVGYSMQEVEALVKASALATDKLLTILGDPTIIQTVGIDARVHVTEYTEALSQLAQRAGVEVPESIQLERS